MDAGITGLYLVLVTGLGRILRNRTRGLRMRIPFEDLPNTLRLLALCQVGRHTCCYHVHACMYAQPRTTCKAALLCWWLACGTTSTSLLFVKPSKPSPRVGVYQRVAACRL